MVDRKRKVIQFIQLILVFGIVVVKDVPAKVCSQCSEMWISSDVASKLGKIVDLARKNRLQFELISFSETKLNEV